LTENQWIFTESQKHSPIQNSGASVRFDGSCSASFERAHLIFCSGTLVYNTYDFQPESILCERIGQKKVFLVLYSINKLGRNMHRPNPLA